MPKSFNPPPGWPTPPRGWRPPTGWKPDPTWPPAPDGWQFWSQTPSQNSGAIALLGSAAVLLGGFLPFVSVSELDGLVQTDITSQAHHLSAGFGGLLLALTFVGQAPNGIGLSRTAQILSILGAIGYSVFTAIGYAGITDMADGFPVTTHFTPNIGILMSAAGCVVTAVSTQRRINAAQQPYKQQPAANQRRTTS